MKKRIMLFATVITALLIFVAQAAPAQAGPGSDCEAFSTGTMPDLSSLDISVNCTVETPVYVGVCDSGGVPNDDLFTMEFGGTVVASNQYDSGDEIVNVGLITAAAGLNTVTLNSISTTPFPPATYSYGVTPDFAALDNYFQSFCGVDFSGTTAPTTADCSQTVRVFTQDQAPSDGTLELRIMLGNENSRETSGLMYTWDIDAGQQLNNYPVSNLPAPRYARLYWQADGSGDWYMLTSQYWSASGTTASEYGISCGITDLPTYHTSFASAVPVADVCFDLLNGCN